MKIALVSHRDNHNPKAGGAEVVHYEISKALLAMGHEVTWLTSSFPGAARREVSEGMEYRRFGPEELLNWRLLPLARRLAPEFDLVIENLCKVPFFWPNRSRYLNIIYTHHLFGGTVFREASPVLAAYVYALETLIPRFYREQLFVAVSPSTRDDLVRRGIAPERITVIESGTDHEFYGRIVSEKDPQPLFVHVGRLKKYKQTEIAMRAFPEVLRRVPTAKLVIIGRGDHEPFLRAEAARLGLGEPALQFLGYVSEHDMRDWMQRAWALLYPSPKEGQGLTVFEAAASGTPAVASNSPGLRDFVRHEQTGLLVEHSDASAWAAALVRLAGERELCKRLGRAAREFSLNFTWARSAGMIIETATPNPGFKVS